ncbi:MAG: SMP-30/gluconolactonase/LRE family protein [Planctomycetaceae bacterium]|nr:SMP-30/gluconolactonase/LRE family protein [Planctomycetaceae bacterium]
MFRFALTAVLAWSAVGPAFADDVASLIAPKAEVKKIVGDCKFTEGPAYSPQGFLLFSDIPNERIVRVGADGTVSDFLKPSGKANGLVFDAAGNLYACQGGARRVVKINAVDGKIEPLAEQYDGKPFNAPNDLAIDTTGGLYFTDPQYGKAPEDAQPVFGVYYINPLGHVTRVLDTLQLPNGILVSPDGRRLYVAEWGKGRIWQHEITGPGKLAHGKVIYTGDQKLDGLGPDGMALDSQGRIYATYSSVVVLNPDGGLIGRIPVPEGPANCTFGGPDGKTLYITARTSLYSLAMTVSGAPLMPVGPKPFPRVSRTSRAIPVVLVSATNLADEVKEIKVEGVTLKAPTSWKQEPPANKLRLAQFKIGPAEGDPEPAELVVSFFRGDGGGVDPNLKRWTDQFAPDGRKEKLAQGTAPQGPYYISDLTGTYLKTEGGPFAGGKKTPMPNFRSLSVIVQVPDEGNYFLRMTGPAKTVNAAAEAFRKSFDGDATKEKPYEMK